MTPKKMNWILRICCLLSLVAGSAAVWGQSLESNRVQQLDGYPFVLCYDGENVDDVEMTDSMFNNIAVGVQFQVNRSDVNLQSDFFKMYHNELLPLLKREGFVLTRLFIRGAASPEGSYENNRQLGQRRTQNLLSLIEGDLQQPDLPPITVTPQSVTEDYRYLVDLMEAAADPDAPEVRALFDQCGWDEPCCKKNLQALQGGKVWKRLLVEYFPRLRSSRIVLLLKHADVIRTSLGMMTDLKPLGINSASAPEGQLYATQRDYRLLPIPVEYTRRHLLAVRTNLLRDFFYMPQFGFAPGIDVQLEYYPKGGHLTYNAAFTWTQHRHWDDHKFFQIRDAQLEVRRYFRGGGEFLGPYLGAYAEGTFFGIGLSETKGWEGSGWGAGLDLGWVMRLNKKGNLRLEFNVSAGYFRAKHDPYVWGNPVTNIEDGKYYYDYHGSAKAFKERNHLFTWLGPTNVGINLTYDILYRKKTLVEKGGMR